MKGKLILVLGPTGSGKGTLIDHAREQFPSMRVSVSCTTRSMRPGETEGTQYYFITKEEFQRRIDAGEFLEWAAYGENLYGTLKSEVLPTLTEGKSMLLEMEVQGVRQVQAALPKENVRAVYIDAGSWEEMERRVRARAPISDEELVKRKKRYEDELTFKPEADAIIKNPTGRLETAKADFVSYLREQLATTDV